MELDVRTLMVVFTVNVFAVAIALPALMAMSEHRSVSSVIGYFQAGGVADNPAANLLGSKS